MASAQALGWSGRDAREDRALRERWAELRLASGGSEVAVRIADMEATGLAVFDWTTLADLVFAGVVHRRFHGYV